MTQINILEKFHSIAIGLVLVLAPSPAVLAEPDNQLPIGIFSESQPGKRFPTGWKPLTFEKISTHTQYDLVKDEDQVVVKAVSYHSSSGLTREITIDPKEISRRAVALESTKYSKKGRCHRKIRRRLSSPLIHYI